jgi:hypothetical protein
MKATLPPPLQPGHGTAGGDYIRLLRDLPREKSVIPKAPIDKADSLNKD